LTPPLFRAAVERALRSHRAGHGIVGHTLVRFLPGRPRGRQVLSNVAAISLISPRRPLPVDDARPARRRLGWLWGTGAVIIGALMTLARIDRPFNTIWAEDGTYFYTDVLNRPALSTLVRPLAGYYVTVSRLLALPSRYVPLTWGPAVLTIGASLFTGLLAVAVFAASRPHVRTTLGRLVVSVPVLAVPVGENLYATNTGNVATLQFIAIYAAIWLLVWRPVRSAQQWAAFALLLTIALSTFLAVLLLPLAGVRVAVARDRLGQGMLGALVVGAGLNLTALRLGVTARPTFLIPRLDPVWALRETVTSALPTAVFGARPTEPALSQSTRVGGFAIAAIVLLAVAVLAAWLWCDPQWTLAAAFGLQAVIVFCGATMSAGFPFLRYVAVLELMLIAALAVMLRPRPGASWSVPTAVLAVCVLAVCAVSFRMPSNRSVETHSWSDLVAQARHVCQNRAYGAAYVYPSLDTPAVGIAVGVPPPDPPPVAWPVRLPCDRLR
jgi:hypothetical protein